jgi:hypothetical protein
MAGERSVEGALAAASGGAGVPACLAVGALGGGRQPARAVDPAAP